MTVRQTSIAAYEQIKEQGLLRNQQLKVYETLYRHGPATAEQIQKLCFRRMGVQAWRRLPELREMGVVKEVGTAKSEVSGRPMTLWDVTWELPVKLEEKRPAREVIQQLTAENVELRSRVEALQAEIQELKTPGAQLRLFR